MEISELFYSFQTSLRARGTLDSLASHNPHMQTCSCPQWLVVALTSVNKEDKKEHKKIISYILRGFSSYYFKHLMTHMKQVWLKASHMLMENKSLDIDKI